MTEPAHLEAWSPEDEPPTRDEALAYERFLRVLLKEEGGKVPEALARKYLNTLLDPEFARRQPRTHARMLENYHKMVQRDRHMAIAQGLVLKEDETPKTWNIRVYPSGEQPAAGETDEARPDDSETADAGQVS